MATFPAISYSKYRIGGDTVNIQKIDLVSVLKFI